MDLRSLEHYALVRAAQRHRDGSAWCFLAIERDKQGYGAQPVHMAGFDWRRTANGMFEAFRVHGLRSVTAEMASLSKAFFVDNAEGAKEVARLEEAYDGRPLARPGDQ